MNSVPGRSAAALLFVLVFTSMALAQGQLNCKLDDAADTLATLFVNALKMKEAKGKGLAQERRLKR